jgi:hypothetical protein
VKFTTSSGVFEGTVEEMAQFYKLHFTDSKVPGPQRKEDSAVCPNCGKKLPTARGIGIHLHYCKKNGAKERQSVIEKAARADRENGLA